MRWPCCESGLGQSPARTFIIEVITSAFDDSTALDERARKPSVRIWARCGVKKSCSPPARAQRPRAFYVSKSRRSRKPNGPGSACVATASIKTGRLYRYSPLT